jgi:hypothetical protein
VRVVLTSRCHRINTDHRHARGRPSLDRDGTLDPKRIPRPRRLSVNAHATLEHHKKCHAPRSGRRPHGTRRHRHPVSPPRSRRHRVQHHAGPVGHPAARSPASIERRGHEWTPREQGRMRGPKVESEARTFNERNRPVITRIVGERRVRVEPGKPDQPVRPRGDVGLPPRPIAPARHRKAGEGDQRRGQYSTSFRCTPLRSISYSSPWMGGRLGYQCTPRMAAGPATGRISCWTSS